MGVPEVINWWFVPAAGLAVVPIIIHLVQRRRIQQVVFSSVRFLRKMSQRVVRRRRLTELLLILLRALALAVLALAFARPFFAKRVERVGAETILGDEAAIILIDNSYSMSADGRLEKAKKQASKALDELEITGKVGVGCFSTSFQMLCPIGSTGPDAQRAIDEVEQSWRGTDLAMVLEQADRLLAQRGEERRRIVLISDFQRSAWQNVRERKLSPRTILETQDVSDRDVPNVLVERVAVPRLVVAGGTPEVVSARLVNLSDRPVQNARVVFKVGGAEVERTSVNIEPRSDMPVRFRYKFDKPGDTYGSIAVEFKDDMQADNTAYFSVPVTPRVVVLLINGDPARQLVRNDGFFLRMALAPEVEGRSSPFAVREVTPETVSVQDLQGADAVILANVEKVPDAVKDALTKFVHAGGGICFLCGQKTRPDVFNASLADLAPCQLVKTVMSEDQRPAAISWVNLRHEIFNPFAGPRTGNIALAEFVQYYEVRRLQAATVLARFDSGYPALLEIEIGKGRSILFPSAMDLEWNNLCLKSVFVPLVHQLAKRLCAEQSAGVRDLIVGDRVAYRLPAPAKKAELRTPDGKKQDLDVRTLGEGSEATNVAAFSPEQPGIYEVAYDGGSARFAVNLDPGEPDLRQLDPKEIESSVHPGPVLSVQDKGGGPTMVGQETARERAENAQRLWTYLIGFVLAALAIEMILAARSGTS